MLGSRPVVASEVDEVDLGSNGEIIRYIAGYLQLRRHTCIIVHSPPIFAECNFTVESSAKSAKIVLFENLATY